MEVILENVEKGPVILQSYLSLLFEWVLFLYFLQICKLFLVWGKQKSLNHFQIAKEIFL